MRVVRRGKQDSPQRLFDVLGILLIASAVITFISLLSPNAGVLGGFMERFFHLAFGTAAWVFPIALFAFGIAIIVGKRTLSFGAMIWGALLLIFAILGFIARPTATGDYFDPQTVTATGGYIGALTGWAFHKLLGDAKWVGLGALAMVAAILCVNVPLQVLLENIRSRMQDIAKRPSSKWKGNHKPKERPRAVVEMPVEEPQKERKAPKPKTEERFQEDPNQTKEPTPPRTEIIPKEGYSLPPLTILDAPEAPPKRSQSEIQQNIQILESTLEEFGIEANVVEIANGPTLTRYEIQLGPGIRVSRIKSLADNLAMSLAASHVRVEAPIPGKAAIGVEVPNAKRAIVRLRQVAESPEFLNSESKLTFCLGQNVGGGNIVADLAQMPHLLISGATNSGKSICLASLITSLLLRNTPKDVRFMLLDPKRVELSLFDGIPHLVCPVVTDIKQMPVALREIWREMDRRYDLFAAAKTRNIAAYNEQASFAEKIPYIVVVIDELADLMIQSAKEVEDSICRIAQLARATGIHLIIATQRPSVDVITGTIKANISSRIAFAVSSQVDSRTILDSTGAENLIGQGDLLFLPIDANKPTRVQGCYVSEEEVERIVQFWKAQAPPQYILDPASAVIEREEARLLVEETEDPFWEDAVRWVAERGQASTSMLQRRFSIGFQRASRLLDMMEERGIVAPRDGPRPREVLISPMEVDEVLRNSPG